MDSNAELPEQEGVLQSHIMCDNDYPLDPHEFSSFLRSESKDNLELQALNGGDTASTRAGSNPKLEFNLPFEDVRQPNLESKDLKDSELECRICQSVGEENLISPCKCCGSTKWVHESCLVVWFQVSRTSRCELCSQKITVKKYTKPVREWRRPGGSSIGPCSKVDLWYLFVTVFSIGTIIGFSVFQACTETEDTETTIVFTAIYVLCALMILLRVRYFYQWFTRRSFFWQKWRRLNQQWFISSKGPAREVQKVPLEEPAYELQEVLSVGSPMDAQVEIQLPGQIDEPRPELPSAIQSETVV